ncbi:NADH peroxidase [Lactiplantibacillus plantarum]|nr:NADH peroxidase [Lactiplantibacillus plantarum]
MAKIIIVGAAHGGRETVNGLLAANTDNEIHWYEHGQFATALDWAPADAEKERLALSQQVTLFDQTTVTKITPATHTITARNQQGQLQTDHYDRLVLSVGSLPIQLPIPGAELSGVRSIQNRASINELKLAAKSAAIKNVVVIGGGYIGMNFAALFKQTGKQVTVIDVNARPFSHNLDSEFTQILAAASVENGLQLKMEERVTAILGSTHVTAVQTNRGQYAADLVLVAVGNRPNTAWLRGTLTLDSEGLIETDDYFQTSVPDIYAIGDATKVRFTPTGTKERITLGSAASHAGRLLAHNLLTDQRIVFPGVQATSVLNAAGYYFAATGLNTQLAVRMQQPVLATYIAVPRLVASAPARLNATVHFKLFYDKTHRILGAQIMSTAELTAVINTVSLAIQMGATLEQLAYGDFFFQPGLSQPVDVLSTASLQALQTLATN